MKFCDCLIGLFHDYHQSEANELRRSNYIERCKNSAESANRINTTLGRKTRKINPKDYLDRRYSMTTIYNYCPECGTKIDLKKLKSQL